MKILSTITAILVFLELSAQCPGNLVINGSFTEQVGEAITAAGWTSGSTPDMNDAGGTLHTTVGYTWSGTPLSSSDGGTWQNLFSPGEYVEQTLNVVPGQTYFLRFEYAAQGIVSQGFTFTAPVGINIYIDNALVHVTPDDLTQYTWEDYCYTFTVQSNSLTLRLSASADNYAGIDGVCLVPASSGFEQEDLGQDTTLCTGETLLLDATTPGATAYLWQDQSIAPTYTVNTAGTYYVKITAGCVYTDTIHVTYTTCENEPEPEPEPEPELSTELEMPNIFTPDNDGINDFFHAKKLVNVKDARLQIVDRWGQLMYEANDLQAGWNGRVNGKDCSEGTYFWILDYTNSKNEQTRLHGFLQLIRK